MRNSLFQQWESWVPLSSLYIHIWSIFLYINNHLSSAPQFNINNLFTSFKFWHLILRCHLHQCPKPPLFQMSSFPCAGFKILHQAAALLLSKQVYSPAPPNPPTQDLTFFNEYKNTVLLRLQHSMLDSHHFSPFHDTPWNALLPHPAWDSTPYTRLSLAFTIRQLAQFKNHMQDLPVKKFKLLNILDSNDDRMKKREMRWWQK